VAKSSGKKTSGKKTKRPGLPSAKTVVTEFTLAPALSAGPGPAAAVAPPGAPQKTYRVLRTNQLDGYDKPLPAGPVTAASLVALAPTSDAYAGTDRKASKLSIGSGKIEEFADVQALLDSLPSVNDMVNHKPKIAITATSGRVTEEQRNVRVQGFLYAASREADNDFHLIIGRDPRNKAAYMTMEVSGLPPASSKSRATLGKARDAFKAFFANQPHGLPGPTYDFYDPPIPVEIEGSLFFDMTHARGSRPGPRDLKGDMPTIWEVHPVTRIVFEP
jgi:hypothetical protein